MTTATPSAVLFAAPPTYTTVLLGSSVQGRDHSAAKRNNQDSYSTWQSDDGRTGFGIVCDGCGGGKQNEVAAGLTTGLLHYAMRDLLTGRACVERIPTIAMGVLSRKFSALFECMDQKTSYAFAVDHLLATVIGFVWRDDDLAIFYLGDGSYILDDAVTVLDHGNSPPYLAHEAIYGQSTALATFTHRRSEVSRVAVATDGLDRSLLLAAFHPTEADQLARWQHSMRMDGHFDDDATVVTARWTSR